MSSTASTSALLYATSVTGPSPKSSQPDDELTKKKAWHRKDHYISPWPSYQDRPGLAIVGNLIWRKITGKANTPDTTPPTVTLQTPVFLHSRTASNKLRATWLGHACFYVEFPTGLRVLFDPVFTERCSPFEWMGPQRYTNMPCQIRDIPIIDAVVISHNHYDHLSHPTVVAIAKEHPECHFFVPLGNKKWFEACNIKNCTEMDWWDEVDLTMSPIRGEKGASVSSTETSESNSIKPLSARISCLPCQHQTGRGPFDRLKTLWSSWSVQSGGANVYFAGDTGYRCVPREAEGKDDWAPEFADLPRCPAFKEIGKLRGPFDLGLIPIGAYTPRWIMSNIHANPRDAVEIFRDTQCKKAIGMHWGTWVLTEEDVLEPPRLLKQALAYHSIPETGVFDVCAIGESREF